MKDESRMNNQTSSSGKQRQISKWLLIVAVALFICWLANHFVPFIGILLMLVFILLISYLIPRTRWFAVLFICGLSGFFVPLCGIPLILFILLLFSASNPQMKRFVKIIIILFVGGAIFSCAARGSWFNFAFLFLPYMAAPILAIIASAIQLRGKPVCGRLTHIFLIIVILGLFLINARIYVLWYSPIIYMPPAITNENIEVYKECIKYVRGHDELKDLVFYSSGVVSESIAPSEPNEALSKGKTLGRISKEPETATIVRQLRQIMCSRFERHDNIVIFYKGNNPVIPMTTKEIWHIWPSGHGVAYSLNDRDPNQSDDPILEEYKPFIRIHGDWYFSRSLLMIGDGRTYYSVATISKTLIDCSLFLDGIDPNKLDEHI